jgi:hypothetical protein
VQAAAPMQTTGASRAKTGTDRAQARF